MACVIDQCCLAAAEGYPASFLQGRLAVAHQHDGRAVSLALQALAHLNATALTVERHAASPPLQALHGRIGLLKVHLQSGTPATALMLNIRGRTLFARPLLLSAYERRVVESRAVVGQLVAPPAERLRGVGVASEVDEHRLALVVHDERANVVVVVALVVVAALYGEMPHGVGRHENLRVGEVGFVGGGLHSWRGFQLRNHA